MHNAILERVKWSLHVKMINLEKIKYEKCQSPPFYEDLPLNQVQSPPPPGEVIKIYFPYL